MPKYRGRVSTFTFDFGELNIPKYDDTDKHGVIHRKANADQSRFWTQHKPPSNDSNLQETTVLISVDTEASLHV